MFLAQIVSKLYELADCSESELQEYPESLWDRDDYPACQNDFQTAISDWYTDIQSDEKSLEKMSVQLTNDLEKFRKLDKIVMPYLQLCCQSAHTGWSCESWRTCVDEISGILDQVKDHIVLNNSQKVKLLEEKIQSLEKQLAAMKSKSDSSADSKSQGQLKMFSK
jgi:hypothetical protein